MPRCRPRARPQHPQATQTPAPLPMLQTAGTRVSKMDEMELPDRLHTRGSERPAASPFRLAVIAVKVKYNEHSVPPPLQLKVTGSIQTGPRQHKVLFAAQKSGPASAKYSCRHGGSRIRTDSMEAPLLAGRHCIRVEPFKAH